MPGTIQSITRAADVLRLLAAAHRAVRLHEIAEALDLPAPTAHGILATLVDLGFVKHPCGGGYQLNGLPQPVDPDLQASRLRIWARSWTAALARQTGLEVLLAVPYEGNAVLLHRVNATGSWGDQPALAALQVTMRNPVPLPTTASAAGLCLLAHAPLAMPSLRELTLEPFTAHTWTDPERLRLRLEAIRREGPAVDVGEHVSGTASLALPITVRNSDPGRRSTVGAIAVRGRQSDVVTAGLAKNSLLKQVRRAADGISAAVQADPVFCAA